MGKIYKTQKIEIVLTYDATFAPPVTAESFSIKYKKPNGECIVVNAIHDSVAKTLSYIGPNEGSYGYDGDWQAWPIANMGIGNSPVVGEPISFYIYDVC